MALPNNLKTAAKALVLTLLLAGVATPTFAAPPPPHGPPMHTPPPMHNSMPSFNFNFGFDVPGFHFGVGNKACLTDRQIIRELQSRGYTRVQIISHNNRHNNYRTWVKVEARKNGQTYTFYVDSCRGNVGFW